MIREALDQAKDTLNGQALVFEIENRGRGEVVHPIGNIEILRDAAKQCTEAITSLDAPFDISKVEGWKAMFVDEVWRFATPEHRWELQLIMNWRWRIVQDDRIVFDGEIKTQSFFVALCGALNIKTKENERLTIEINAGTDSS